MRKTAVFSSEKSSSAGRSAIDPSMGLLYHHPHAHIWRAEHIFALLIRALIRYLLVGVRGGRVPTPRGYPASPPNPDQREVSRGLGTLWVPLPHLLNDRPYGPAITRF